MELSERFIETLEKEGFTNVYEWQDGPGVVYSPATNPSKISFYITDGSITFLINGVQKEGVPGKRIDIPAHVTFSAIVGNKGVIYIKGED